MGGHAAVLEDLHPPATVATRVMGEPEFQKVQGDWAPAALTLVIVDGHVLLRISTSWSSPPSTQPSWAARNSTTDGGPRSETIDKNSA